MSVRWEYDLKHYSEGEFYPTHCTTRDELPLTKYTHTHIHADTHTHTHTHTHTQGAHMAVHSLDDGHRCWNNKEIGSCV